MTARPSYRVARARPLDVRADLERLWGANLQVDGGVRAKFDWLYRDAPVPADTVFLLHAGDDGAVGTAGVGVRELQLGDQLARAGLLADLAVDKAHRSVGPALALVRDVKAWAAAEFALMYGFPNKLAEGVFKRVGYQTLGAIARYARPLRHGAYASRLVEDDLQRLPAVTRAWLVKAVQVPAVAAMAGIAVDAAKLARGVPAAMAAGRLQHAIADAPDPRFDELWTRARGEYAIVTARTARFLAWRFPPRPGRSWRLALDRRSGALRAYAIVDRIDGVAHVRDLFGHRDEVLAVLDRLPIAQYRAGASSLSMRYLGAPWLADALLARGFAVRQADRMIAVATGTWVATAAAPSVLDPAAWHLTDADEDV